MSTNVIAIVRSHKFECRLILLVGISTMCFALFAAPPVKGMGGHIYDATHWSVFPDKESHECLEIKRSDTPLLAVWLDDGWLKSMKLLDPSLICPRLIIWKNGDMLCGPRHDQWLAGVYVGKASADLVSELRNAFSAIESWPKMTVGPLVADGNTVIAFVQNKDSSQSLLCNEDVLSYANYHNGVLVSKETQKRYAIAWNSIKDGCRNVIERSKTQRVADFVTRESLSKLCKLK
ncbi:MAG: hypothetical protein V4719_03755 [Planctomycetota bacterium]